MPSDTPNLSPETWMFSGAADTIGRCLEKIDEFQRKYGYQCRLLIGPVPPNQDKPKWTFQIWVDYPEPRDVARSMGLPRSQWPAREIHTPHDRVTAMLEEQL